MTLDEAKAYLAGAGTVDSAVIDAMASVVRSGSRQDIAPTLTHVSGLPGATAAQHETLGFIAFAAGLHEQSLDHYAAAARLAPADPVVWYNLASAQRNLGRLDEAQQSCDRALRLAPFNAQAALLRSHLRRQTHQANNIDALRAALGQVLPNSTEAIFFHYALGKELDDLADYERAWAHFAAGAAARRRALQYDVQLDLQKLARIQATSSRRELAACTRAPATAHYGFIIGLPRSGTTLVERVLTASPGAVSNGETDNFLAALMEGTPPHGGDIFARVACSHPATVQEAYARKAGHATKNLLVLEKLPMNYLYAGAIARNLPDAQMLLLERNLVDNCFGMFSTLFGAGYPFSYDLAELAQYAVAYRALTRHWQDALGDRLATVSYDEFVSSPASVGPAMSAHLGITWNPSMALVEHNAQASATASAVQVRQPIYRTSSGRWRNYERPLRPLIDALSSSGLI